MYRKGGMVAIGLVVLTLLGSYIYVKSTPYISGKVVEGARVFCVANMEQDEAGWISYTYHEDVGQELKPLLQQLCKTIRTVQSSDIVPVNEIDEIARQQYEGMANIVLVSGQEAYYLYFDNIPFDKGYANLRVKKTEVPEGIFNEYQEGEMGRGLYCKADQALIDTVAEYVDKTYGAAGD